jgi:tRNA modification GTPase
VKAKPQGSFQLLTPPGEGGIAVIGIEGPGAREALLSLTDCRRLPGSGSGQLLFGHLLDEGGGVLDEIIIADRSCSGSERFELNCHGGAAAASSAMELLQGVGLILSESGTALGRTSLERALARDLESAGTKRQVAALCRAYAALVSEYACGQVDLAWLWSFLQESFRLKSLLTHKRVVLAGPANAGKSTLLNRLAGVDRAITSTVPGTTRDAVEIQVSLRGITLNLVDTAGLFTGASCQLTRESQEQTRQEIFGSDLLIYLYDAGDTDLQKATAEFLSEFEALAGEIPVWIIAANKCDLAGSSLIDIPTDEHGSSALLQISARTGQGVEQLLDVIESLLLPDPPQGGAGLCDPEVLQLLQDASTCAWENTEENAGEAVTKITEILGSLLMRTPA